ncbi:MAG: polyprenyl synthetase family protein [Vulcanimicrobiaceae bacterium]
MVGEMLAYHFGFHGGESHRRGKRLRPRLLLTAAQEMGAPLEGALEAAVAIELLHNYSLIHDDIEDGDRYRHGRETLWVRFGEAQAINAGDALCALSFLALLAAAKHFAPQRLTKMVERLHFAHLAMCHGQSLDLSFEDQADVTVARYLEMIGGKTAALFAVSCELAAMCAGLGEAEVHRYRALGSSFGIAFQVYDDMMSIWGDAASTGKLQGGDIARRKKTFPIVWALEGAASPQREVIFSAYTGDGAMAPETVAEVMRALTSLGAREAARLAAANHLAVVERAPRGRVRDFLLQLIPLGSPA